MIDSLKTAHHSRDRHPRVTVASELTPELATQLDRAVRAFDSNRSKMIRACVELGLPLVIDRAKRWAADQQQSRG